MTFASTPIYDEWITVLTNECDISDNNAQLLVDSIVGDPRIAFSAPETEQDVTDLRKQVSTIIDEFDLTEFGEITDHEVPRQELLTKFDSHMVSEPTNGEESSGSKDTEAAADESISVEVTDNERAFAPGAAAGAGAEAPGGDIQPREDIPPDEQASNENTSSTGDSGEADSGQTQDEEEEVPQDLPLEHELARVVLSAHYEEINDDLDVPLDLVSADMITYGATVISAYENFLAAELFPDRSEHEQKVLFESMVKSRIEENFQRIKEKE